MSGPKYSVIYADPPWSYDDAGCNGAAELSYRTMSIQDITLLPVHRLAADDCVLFMWATYPLLREALTTIACWGFDYKSIAFQWVKTNPKAGTPFFGLGRWTRGNTEPCLLATRGKPKRIGNDVSQLIQSPVGRHSAKPGETRERIVQLMGDVSRVELFARERVDGWDSTGLDLDGVDVRVLLEALGTQAAAE